MEGKISMVQKVVPTPSDYWCENGHFAKGTFKIDGINEEPIRFVKISGENINTKIVCEPCLIIANHLAKLLKKESK